ncbi:MAG TPA: NGG1p interacting factor NIF3 [Candidatus Omnitrophica bacterium]|nr:NGG1p interacting factor NIF3 [Candidatus Omnitrophota bacterium]
MKLKKIYDLAVLEGIVADPRGKTAVYEELKRTKEQFESLNPREKEYFDRERLVNPYDDTRILSGDQGTEVKTVLAGIDIDASELLLADRMNSKNRSKIDLVMSHHPQGLAYANFYEVMDMQADILACQGIPINICEKLVETRKKEVGRKIHAANHNRATDAARLLGLPFMCAHTPADNHVVTYLNKIFSQKKPAYLKNIMDILLDIAEYKTAKKEGSGPVILLGGPNSRCGRIFVDMTGGTEGPKDIIANLSAAGIGTIVGMHLSEEHYKKYQEKNMNVVIAGHIASDNLGMNLLLDKIEKVSKLNILSCSGLRRTKR